MNDNPNIEHTSKHCKSAGKLILIFVGLAVNSEASRCEDHSMFGLVDQNMCLHNYHA